VSSDQTEEAMFHYMKESHGDWFALPFEDKIATELSNKYGKITVILDHSQVNHSNLRHCWDPLLGSGQEGWHRSHPGGR